VVVASADKHDTDQYEKLQENISVLKAYRTPQGEALTVVELPFPEPRKVEAIDELPSYDSFEPSPDGF
jgi:agmatine/peptidylarginine deiminase